MLSGILAILVDSAKTHGHSRALVLCSALRSVVMDYSSDFEWDVAMQETLAPPVTRRYTCSCFSALTHHIDHLDPNPTTLTRPPYPYWYLRNPSTGFCGCLSTYSTFALELHKLPTHRAWVYGAATFLTSQVGAVEKGLVG